MNVVLVGGESAGTQTLKLLADSPHRVVGVVAAPDKDGSLMPGLWTVATRMGHRLWPAKAVKDPGFGDELRSHKVDVILNVHSLYVIHDQVLNAARVGCFNLHPAPLPRYAGLNSVSWAIYRGETCHGVTVHQIVPAIDAGAIVYQSVFPVATTESALSVATRCANVGLQLLGRLLETLAHGADFPAQPQDLSQREYFGKEVPENGCVRWLRSAGEIVNFVRACDFFPFPSRWGHPRAIHDGTNLCLLKASLTGERTTEPPGTVGQSEETSVRVACGDEWILLHRLLIGERRVDASSFLKPGDRLHDGQ